MQTEQQQTASAKPFNQRQATVVGIVLIVLGGLSVLCNIVDLCLGTGIHDLQKYASRNADGSLSRTMSHVSLGVVAHGFWAGGTTTAFLVLSIIGAVLAIAQIIIAGFGAEESYDYRTYFLNTYQRKDRDCTSFTCDEITALFAMELLLLLLGVGALIACLWSLMLCCIAKGCCAPIPVAASEDTSRGQQATASPQQQSQSTGATDTQQLPWSDSRKQKVTTLYDEPKGNGSAPSQEPPAYEK